MCPGVSFCLGSRRQEGMWGVGGWEGGGTLIVYVRSALIILISSVNGTHAVSFWSE